MANQSIYNAFERMWQHVVAIVGNKSDKSHVHDERYYTESEIDTKLSGKANSSHTHSISNVTDLQSTLDLKVPTSRTVNGKTLSANITLSASDVGADASGSASAVQSNLDSHDANTTKHITSTERTNWNAAKTHADSAHVTGVKGSSESSYRTGNVNITASNIGLGNVNNTSDANKPVSTAQQTAIDSALANAKSYTDTEVAKKANTSHSHSDATQAASGYMSASDKAKLDNGGIPIATTLGDGSAYTATVDGITTLTVGAKITIIPHTVSTAVAPTLNINGLGAKAIRMPVAYNTSSVANGAIAGWLAASKPITLEYNGSYWLTIGMQRASAQYLYGTVPIANGGTGATDATTARTNLGAASQTEFDELKERVDALESSIISVYTGSSTNPSDTLGEDGDIYLTV